MTLTDSDRARQEVLERIAAVRSARETVRAGVRSGDVSYDDIFTKAAENPAIADMLLLPLIEVIPDVGKVQSRRALESLGLDETILVRDLPPSRRTPLHRLLIGDRLASDHMSRDHSPSDH